MEWIDSNQERLEDLVVQRAIERSRGAPNRSISRRSEEAPRLAGQTPELTYDKFYDDKMLKLIKVWIKGIFKELFKAEKI